MDRRTLQIPGPPPDDDISYIAAWHQRHGYESAITLACNEEDRQAGPMNARKDFGPTATFSQAFDKKKDDRILLLRGTRE